MDGFLKQSTAATLKLGPFVDDTDGKTAETGLTIAQADVRLSKNGGDFAQKNEATSCTHDESGYYDCPVDATDTNTLSRLKIAVSKSGALPRVHTFTVLAANVYDSLVGATDKLQVDAVELVGVGQSLTDLKDFADTGYDPATHKVAGVVLTDTCTTNTDMRGTDSAALEAGGNVAAIKLQTDKLAFAGTGPYDVKATLDSEKVTVTSNEDKTGYALGVGGIANTAFAAGAIDNAAIAADAIGAAEIAADAIGASELAADAAAEVADKLLGRNLGGGSDGGRDVRSALRALRNKRSIAGGTLTVTAEDDTTPAWTAAVTTTAGNPVSSIDPA